MLSNRRECFEYFYGSETWQNIKQRGDGRERRYSTSDKAFNNFYYTMTGFMVLKDVPSMQSVLKTLPCGLLKDEHQLPLNFERTLLHVSKQLITIVHSWYLQLSEQLPDLKPSRFGLEVFQGIFDCANYKSIRKHKKSDYSDRITHAPACDALLIQQLINPIRMLLYRYSYFIVILF
jgi:hypothetical protein